MTILNSITRETITQAIEQARTACQASNDQRWLRAVNKAGVELMIGHWRFNGSTLVIASSEQANTFYTVTALGCTCTAGKKGTPCKHRAARRILCNVIELGQAVAPTPSPALETMPMLPRPRRVYADVLAECDEIC